MKLCWSDYDKWVTIFASQYIWFLLRNIDPIKHFFIGSLFLILVHTTYVMKSTANKTSAKLCILRIDAINLYVYTIPRRFSCIWCNELVWWYGNLSYPRVLTRNVFCHQPTNRKICVKIYNLISQSFTSPMTPLWNLWMCVSISQAPHNTLHCLTTPAESAAAGVLKAPFR